jgi:hypothetical protein
MIWGRFRIVICFMALMIVMEQSQSRAEETAAQQRLIRVLTARREPSRLVAIAKLRTQPDQLRANLGCVMQATQVLLDQHASEIADEDTDVDNPQPLVKKTSEDRASVPESITQLLGLLGSTHDEDAHSLLIQSLDHPDARIAMNAMDIVGQYRLEAAIDDLAMQIRRPEFDDQYAFRFTLVRAIAQIPCPRSVELLQNLHAQLRGQLRHEIATRLANVDLRDFGGDRELYAQFLQKHPPESFVSPVSFEIEPDAVLAGRPEVVRQPEKVDEPNELQLQDVSSESAARLRLANSHYYGINLHAGRMLFVIDRSGSMREAAHYQTRLQSAKQELTRVIEELSPETDFGIKVFDTTVQSWRSTLLPATKANKLAAIAFVQRIQLGDKTNTHAVLSEALEFDDQLEAVFILTDGQPTTGNIRRPDAIVDDIVNRNRQRHLKFHTIGIGVRGVTSQFLESLAEKTGGEFREVN